MEACVVPKGVQTRDAHQTMFWHWKMAHLHYQSLYTLSAKNLATRIPRLIKAIDVCTWCMVGKQWWRTIPQKTHSRAKEVLELIHTYICKPFSTPLFYGSRYFTPLLMITIENLGCSSWRKNLMHCLHSKPSRMNLRKR